jgi:hypothetical protein
MVQLSIEDATRIANKLGEMPVNQVYNEFTLIFNAISAAQVEKFSQSPMQVVRETPNSPEKQ